jgi:hypothetical protein
MINAKNILIGTVAGNVTFWKPSRRWEDNIKRNLKEIEWIQLYQFRAECRALVNTVMSFREFVDQLRDYQLLKNLVS